MKKLITICLAVLMVVSMAFSLTACGGVTDIIGKITNEDNLGGDGGGETTETKTEKMKTKKEIETALGDNYEITLKYGYKSSNDDDGATYITTKSVGNSLYTVVKQANDEDHYFTHDGMVYMEFDKESKKFTACAPQGEYDLNPNVYKQLMDGYEKNLDYDTKKSGKFLDRNVTTYKWTESATVIIASVKYEWEYVVDNETGLILKKSMTYSGSSVEGSTSSSLCFEVTKMKVGGLTMTEELKTIGIKDWLTAQDVTTFTMSGAVDKIDGEFISSRATIEDSGIASTLEYYYAVTDSAIFDTLCQNFYNAGFKKDYDHETANFADLKEETKFYGRIAEKDSTYYYSVEITLTLPYYEGGDYGIEVSLYNCFASADYE